MSAYIKNLIDYNGDIVYPQTRTDAIFDQYGNLLSDVIACKPTILTGTLSAGQTEITFTNSAITEDSIIDVYTNVYSVNPTDIISTTGNITLQFYQQENDVQVRVEVRG